MESNADQWLLVGIGEILWDMLPEGRRLGGAPANFAMNAHALGASALIVSCVGEDAYGDEIIVRLEEAGIDASHIAVDPQYPTGTVQVTLDAAGVPSYEITRDVAWDHIPADPRLAEVARRADVVCFGTLCQRDHDSRGTILGFLDATQHHCLRIFDVNLRQSFYDRRSIHDLMKRANVVKLSDEELGTVAALLDIEGSEDGMLVELASRYSLLLIVLTRGSRGSRLFAPLENAHHPGFSASIADTVGAGDSFTAATALGLMHGWSLDKIGNHANRLASFVCGQEGATPPIPEEYAAPFRRHGG